MKKFLLDENLSPKTATFLQNAGHDVTTVKEAGLKGRDDEHIVAFAEKEKRIIITFDLDFGEIYYFSSKIETGVIVLRLKSQWYDNVNSVLLNLLESGKLETEEFKRALIIVTEDRYRIRRK